MRKACQARRWVSKAEGGIPVQGWGVEERAGRSRRQERPHPRHLWTVRAREGRTWHGPHRTPPSGRAP